MKRQQGYLVKEVGSPGVIVEDLGERNMPPSHDFRCTKLQNLLK